MNYTFQTINIPIHWPRVMGSRNISRWKLCFCCPERVDSI